jgi:hypothetical protein
MDLLAKKVVCPQSEKGVSYTNLGTHLNIFRIRKEANESGPTKYI